MLVTVRMRSLDPRFAGTSRVLSSVSFVIEPFPLGGVERRHLRIRWAGRGAELRKRARHRFALGNCKPECLLRCLFTDNFLRVHLFCLMPTGIGVVFLHGFGESLGLLAKIFFVHDSILVHDERHHAR